MYSPCVAELFPLEVIGCSIVFTYDVPFVDTLPYPDLTSAGAGVGGCGLFTVPLPDPLPDPSPAPAIAPSIPALVAA